MAHPTGCCPTTAWRVGVLEITGRRRITRSTHHCFPFLGHGSTTGEAGTLAKTEYPEVCSCVLNDNGPRRITTYHEQHKKSNKKDPQNGENRWNGDAAKPPAFNPAAAGKGERNDCPTKTLSRSYLTALYDINLDTITALLVTPRTAPSLAPSPPSHTHNTYVRHGTGSAWSKKKCRNQTR